MRQRLSAPIEHDDSNRPEVTKPGAVLAQIGGMVDNQNRHECFTTYGDPCSFEESVSESGIAATG